MAVIIKQSTAMTHLMGPFIDNTDGVTAKTALSITQALTRLSKNGGDPAQKNESSTAVHKENGYYAVSLDTTDTNTVGRLRLMVTITGAMPVADDFIVIAASAYNAMVAGTAGMPTDISTLVTTNLDATVTSRLASASYTAPDNASITTILGRTDVATSTRLASASYTAPDNASITTILGRTDVATSTRLATSGYTAPDNADVVLIKTATDKLNSMVQLNGANYEYKTTALVNAPGVNASTIWGYSGRSLDSDPTLNKVSTMLEAGTAPLTYQFTADALENAPGVDASTIWAYSSRSLTDKTGFALAVTPPTAAQIDTQLSGTHGNGAWGGASGTGSIAWTYNVFNSDTGDPLDGVSIKITSDIAGLHNVASGISDAFGNATFYLDAGTYYVWCQHSGYNFSNPDTEVVS
jgi:hypothetical protein